MIFSILLKLLSPSFCAPEMAGKVIELYKW